MKIQDSLKILNQDYISWKKFRQHEPSVKKLAVFVCMKTGENEDDKKEIKKEE